MIKKIIKRSVYAIENCLGNIFFPLVIRFNRLDNKKKKYYFSICAIFKDEARYMKEWIEYHRILGVDHIFLYNNFSSDNYLNIIQQYIDEGFVTLIEWPYKLAQMSAYQHCYNNFRNETFWLMFIDLDEFICPLYETDIKKWIKKYEKYPSVIMYWLMFGTNGITEYNPDKLVIEQYTCSWNGIRNVGKIALNTRFRPVKMYHHYIYCWVKFLGVKLKVPSVNERCHFVFNYNIHKIPSKNTIQINHYWSKCLSEYVRKIDKGDMFSETNDELRKQMSFFFWHEYHNVAENKVIFRFLIKLKMRMNGIVVKFR